MGKDRDLREPRSPLMRYAYGLSDDRKDAIWATVLAFGFLIAFGLGFNGEPEVGLVVMIGLTVGDMLLIRRIGIRRQIVIVATAILLGALNIWKYAVH